MMSEVMSSPSSLIRALQAIGITSTAFLSGGMTTISIMAVPALLTSPIQPSTALSQWASMYALGKLTTPPSLSLTTLIFLYLSYAHYPSSPFSAKPFWQLYLLAGGMVGSVLVFTFAVLEKTNHEMLKVEKKARIGKGIEGGDILEEGKSRELIERWKVLNLARGVILGVAAGVGVYAVVG